MPRLIKNKLVLRVAGTATLVAATLVAAGNVACAAEPAVDNSAAAQNVFASAVAYAQARCVKLYGAGIGRDHGYATGIIVSADGKVLCAQGVYLAADRIRLVLPDGSTHVAEVLRRSDAIQTALLKIDVPTPNYFDVPDVCPAKKGDWVLAVSNLFKVAEGTEELSVNMGVASLRTKLEAHRGFSEVRYDSELLLIDAITSNPGAPGGAVVTADGKLAGMIGKIIEGTATNTRLNYAVPADLLRKFIDDKPIAEPATPSLVSTDKIKPGTFGILLFTLSGKRSPAYIDRVQSGSPAEKAGLKKDDLVLGVGAEIVHSVGDYQKAIADLKAGVEMTLLIKRGNDIQRVTMVSVEVPSATPANAIEKPVAPAIPAEGKSTEPLPKTPLPIKPVDDEKKVD